MATRSCCSIPHTAAAGVRSATSEPAPCRSTKHSNASATIHTSWNYGRPTSERPQLIDTHDEYRSLETTVLELPYRILETLVMEITGEFAVCLFTDIRRTGVGMVFVSTIFSYLRIQS